MRTHTKKNNKKKSYPLAFLPVNSNSFLQCSQGVTCWIWFPSALQRFLEKQQPRTASWEVCKKQTGWRVKFQLPQRNLCPKNQFLQLHFLGFLWLLWRILGYSFPTPQRIRFVPSAKAPEILGLEQRFLEKPFLSTAFCSSSQAQHWSDLQNYPARCLHLTPHSLLTLNRSKRSQVNEAPPGTVTFSFYLGETSKTFTPDKAWLLPRLAFTKKIGKNISS